MKWRKVENKILLENDAMELSLKEFYMKQVLLSMIADRQTAWDLGCAKVNIKFFFASFPKIRDRRTIKSFLKKLEEAGELFYFAEDENLYFMSIEIRRISAAWAEQTKKELKEKPYNAGQLERKIIEQCTFAAKTENLQKCTSKMQAPCKKNASAMQEKS